MNPPNEKESRATTPLPPYDLLMGERLDMYDNMDYERDILFANTDLVKMESGNVKSFATVKLTEPRKIGGD